MPIDSHTGSTLDEKTGLLANPEDENSDEEERGTSTAADHISGSGKSSTRRSRSSPELSYNDSEDEAGMLDGKGTI